MCRRIGMYADEIVTGTSLMIMIWNRGGVEDTRLEAKAKDTKKIRGQGQGPRTQMLVFSSEKKS